MPQKRMSRNNKRNRKPSKRMNMSIATVVPNAFRTTMVYHMTGALTEAAVNTGVYAAFSLIDLNDPDKTGVGLQPVGYDQWGQMYSRFKVTGFKVELQYVNRNDTDEVLVGWFIHNSLAPTSSVQAWPAQRYAAARLLQASSGGNSTTTMTVSIPIWDVMSITKQQYMDELDFTQVSGAGPTKQAYISVFAQGFGTVASVRFDYKMKYTVELSDPVSLGMS